MSTFLDRYNAADCTGKNKLYGEWERARRGWHGKEDRFAAEYGARAPATCAKGTVVAAASAATPAAPAAPPPSQTPPPAGTAPATGERYNDPNAVWEGGDVTRRACEIKQKGAKGACDRFGYPWGIDPAAAVVPAAVPADNGGQGGGSSTPIVITDSPAAFAGGGLLSPFGTFDSLTDSAGAKDAKAQAKKKDAGGGGIPSWVIWGGVAVLVGGAMLKGSKRRRRARDD